MLDLCRKPWIRKESFLPFDGTFHPRVRVLFNAILRNIARYSVLQ